MSKLADDFFWQRNDFARVVVDCNDFALVFVDCNGLAMVVVDCNGFAKVVAYGMDGIPGKYGIPGK